MNTLTSRSKKTLAAAIVSALTLLGIGAVPSTAVAPNQRVDIVFVGTHPGVVIARGVVNDVGTAEELTTINPDGTFHGTLVFRLRNGVINAPFTGAITSVHLDPNTCIGSFTTVGAFTAGTSTGAYAGIGGGGTFTERGRFVQSRTATGCSGVEVFRVLRTEAVGTLLQP